MTEREPFSRRRFLQLLAAAGASQTFAGCGSETTDAPVPAVEKVIVVGAGFSGLTVANALASAGVAVEVIEGRDRLGGRLWTVDFGGTPIDLGGAWMHGIEGNPVACFAAANGISWTSAEVVDGTTSAFDPHSGFLPGMDLLEFVVGTMSRFEASIDEIRGALGAQASLEQAVAYYLDREGLRGDPRRYADFALRQGIVELFYGGPAELTSLTEIFRDEEFAGGNHFPSGGYGRMVEILARDLDIRLGEVVETISVADDGVRVETDGGVYRGSHVVVTVPLGILKAETIRFRPRLPEWKRAAIERLDMGNFEKVVLEFERSFWSEARRRNFVYLSDRYGEFPLYFDLGRYTRRPTLLCFYGGRFAREAAALDDEQVTTRVLQILEQMFPGAVHPPVRVARTRWFSDPFSYGSYSYVPVGASLEDMDRLGDPVGARLLFAGEATVPAYYGTVAAAMISGLREARRLLGRSAIDLSTGPAPDVGCSRSSA